MVTDKYRFTCVGAVLLFLVLNSCVKPKPAETVQSIQVGKKIDLMGYAVDPIGMDSTSDFIKPDSEYKIVTYTNIYCAPCWESALLWKENLKYFKDNPQVSFYFYVHSKLKDFELRNADAKFEFPVFLDTRGRFRIVNQLGLDINQLTFLLNKKNEILIIGPPFTPEMREKYLAIIGKSK